MEERILKINNILEIIKKYQIVELFEKSSKIKIDIDLKNNKIKIKDY